MPDLVIGSRRASPGRALRATGLLVALGVTALVVAWFIYRRSVAYEIPDGEPPSVALEAARADGAEPRLRWGDAELRYVGSIAVVRASGEPFAIGAAHGRLLAPRLPATLDAIAPSIDALSGPGGWLWPDSMRKDWRLRFVDDGVTDRHRRALAGMVRAAAQSGVSRSYQESLRAAVALDIGPPSTATAEAQTRNLSRALTVVMPQATAAADRLWIGRSFALPGLSDGGEATSPPVLFIARPTGRQAWASVGWPGLTGVVTGVNAAGLAVMVHPTRTRDVRVSRSAAPMALVAREVLEECGELDCAVKKIEATPTLGAAAFVIVDGARGKWAVVDRSPTRFGVRRAPPGRAVGDVLASTAFADDPENDRQLRTSASVPRVARAERLATIAPTDAGEVAALLRDRRGVNDAALPLGHRAAIDDVAAAHVIILDPASLQLWIGDGAGASARLRGFDLRHELRGEGERPSPPTDVAADPSGDPDAALRVRAARRELRTARKALAGGSPRRAAEGVARAEALAPELPELWVTAGAVAQARGDRDATLAAWRRWFALGADDPGLAATLASSVAR